MNQFVPDWSNMGDNSRPLGEDDDLIELLWCNGHVVMQSQTNRKLPPRPEKPPAPPGPNPTTPTTAAAPVAAPTQEDEAGVWFPFALADSLDNKDIFSDLFCEPPPPPPPAVIGKPCCTEDVSPEEDEGGSGACGLMPPPKSTHHLSCCSRQQTTISIGGDDDLSELVRAAGRGRKKAEASSSSMVSVSVSAIGSSICGSNQVVVPRGTPDTALPSAVGSANAIKNADGRGRGRDRDRAGGGHEATVASSSGRSNGRFGAATTTEEPTSTTSNRSSKRKRLDTEEEDAQSPSEDAESESAAAAAACEPPPKLTTARRSRAAEVHNLSERRRRDRINEKMRALQQLIPNCNKADKASMLDEAIEYLKSLQMQVQMMWMGSGIAAPPVMFPGVHQYLPRMGVGTMPRMPPFMAPQPPVNPVPLSAAVGITEPYAHYLGVNHLQPTPTQGVSYYPQQNPAALHMPASGTAAAPGPESAPNTGPASRGL